jgi:hypothetical protein
MLDSTQEVSPEKVTLTSRPEVKPTPICTVMTDGSLKIEQSNISPLDLQRLLLSSAAHVTAQVLQRSMQGDRILAVISQRFEGFDEETEAAMRQHLGR